MKRPLKLLLLISLMAFLLVVSVLSSTLKLAEYIPAIRATPAVQPVNIDYLTVQKIIAAVEKSAVTDLSLLTQVQTSLTHIPSRGLRDPFQAAVKAPKSSPAGHGGPKIPAPAEKHFQRPRIALGGILWDPADPYVIADDRVYKLGDTIQGYTIQTITDTMIILSNRHDEFKIVVPKD